MEIEQCPTCLNFTYLIATIPFGICKYCMNCKRYIENISRI